MLFNSQIFLLLFLPLCLLGFYKLKSQRSKTLFLLVASLFFYAWWDVRFFPILIITLLFNWLIGHTVTSGKISNVKTYFSTILPLENYLVYFAIGMNLFTLAFFKYFNFLSENMFMLLSPFLKTNQAPQYSIILPLGISFFTFHYISYLIDLKNKKVPAYSLLDFSFYICFFPHLIAGPIIRHNELIPQISGMQQTHYKMIGQGLMLLCIGLIKKVFIADTIAAPVNFLFDAAKTQDLTCIEAWFACIGFGMQIYFDFSGYSDMAVGLGKMFGFSFPNNFHSPYRSTSLRDFWQRWHITLSHFLRDYLYIGLGGNRLGMIRQNINLAVTMLLAGLWHGAGWTFLIWGGLHGAGLIINHAWMRTKIKLPAWFSWILTISFVFFCWILFRSETFIQAKHIFRSLFNLHIEIQKLEWKNMFLLLPGIFVLTYKVNSNGLIEKIQPKIWWGILIGLALTWCIFQTGAESAIEFIYFQF